MKPFLIRFIQGKTSMSTRMSTICLSACATVMIALTVYSYLQILRVPPIILAEKFQWMFLGTLCGALAFAMSVGVLLSLRMMRKHKS